MTRSVDSRVVKLDLTGTDIDIDKFRKKSRENLASLTTLVNGTERLEEIRVEYQDAEDPGKVYSLVYEGEALKKELQAAADLWQGLADAAERQYGVKNVRPLTPREIAAALTATPAQEAAVAFAMLYETIRYADLPCGEGEVWKPGPCRGQGA